jgi:hypothetical protein
MSDAPTIYNFDPVGGAYVGASLADPSPLEEGVWLHPAWSTTIAPPPAGPQQTPVFVAGAWALIADHRGETWYAKSDGAPFVVTGLGPPEDTLTPLAPPKPGDHQAAVWRDDAWALDPSYVGAFCYKMLGGEPTPVMTPGDPAAMGLTPIAPPRCGPNQTPIFADGAWTIEPDYVGEAWFDASGAPVVVTALGDPAALGLRPTPPPTQGELAASLAAAASAACTEIVSKIYPDAAHQAAFQNAASIVNGNAGAAPTVEPLATKFASLAAIYGLSASGFAALVIAMQAASFDLSAALAVLNGGAADATTPVQLAAALTAFETALAAAVAEINAAGLPVTTAAPPAIRIAGINA